MTEIEQRYEKTLEKQTGISTPVQDLKVIEGLSELGLEPTDVDNAILKSHNTQSTAEQIDESVFNGNIVPLAFTKLNGTSSYINLDKDYVLANDGDYVEFVCKWNNLSSYPNSTEGILGKNDGTTNNTIGLVSGNQLYIRGNTSTWMIFNIGTLFNPSVFNKFKLDVVGTDLQLTLNNVVISSVALASPITINNIGRGYSTNYIACTFQSLKLSTSQGTLLSNDIINDTNLTKVDLLEDVFYKENLTVNYNGLDSFIVYKKQRNSKYIAYLFRHVVNATINSDNWRIENAILTDENFVSTRYLMTGGEWETAIKLKEGAILADDFIGGQAHGDETLVNFTALIDGVKIDTSSSFSGKARKVEFLQATELFCPTGLTYAGTKVANTSKRWEFNESRYNKLFNRVDWVYNVELQDTYLFMIPIKRTDSLGQLTDTFTVSPLFDEIDVTNSWHSNPFYIGSAFGGSVREWSSVSNISADVNILKGWDTKATAEFNVSPDTLFNKLYFDFTGISTASNGDIFDIEVEFDLFSK